MKSTLAKLLTTAAVAGLGMVVVPQANATILQFVGATMTDGGTITGWFDYDPVLDTVGAVVISTTPGGAITSPLAYTTGTYISPTRIDFGGGGGDPHGLAIEIMPPFAPATWDDLALGVVTSVTIKPSFSPFLAPSNEYVTPPGGTQLRGVSGGIIVPEPSTYAMVAGLGMVAFGAYRRLSRKA